MMERGTPSDIRPDPRFLDIHAPTPKVFFPLTFTNMLVDKDLR
jgi:hypothetical protein